MDRLKKLLGMRGATVRSSKPCPSRWIDVARMLANRYRVFDGIRPNLASDKSFSAETEAVERLCQSLLKEGFLQREGESHLYRRSQEIDRVRFITGDWLEHLAAVALRDAGTDVVLPSVLLQWRVDQYRGENEVDVIARQRDRLIFVSCKCVSSSHNKNTGGLDDLARKRLMQDLLEADDLADHFGAPGDAVVLVVTADLIDELRNNRVRYSALFGKAKALEVELISLEDLSWRSLLAHMRTVVGTGP